MASGLGSLGIEEGVEYKIVVGKTFKNGRKKYNDVRCWFFFFFFFFSFSFC